MMNKHSLCLTITVFFSWTLLAEDHSFVGMWQPELESTLENARSHPDFSKEDEAKMMEMLPQFIAPMRMQLDGSTLLMNFGSSHQQSAPYTVESSEQEKLVILIRPPELKESVRAVFTKVGEDRLTLSIEENNDMDLYVWKPAESMEVEDLNVAAVVAGAMGASEPAEQPAREVRVEKTIGNNLRVIEASAMQYMLEHGVNTVTFAELEGEYFKSIPSINGEAYNGLTLTSGMKSISVTDKDGKVYVRDMNF